MKKKRALAASRDPDYEIGETMRTKWTLEVQEDPETGDAILQFPPDFLESAGWKEGDTIEWKDLGDGSWSLTKQA